MESVRDCAIAPISSVQIIVLAKLGDEVVQDDISSLFVINPQPLSPDEPWTGGKRRFIVLRRDILKDRNAVFVIGPLCADDQDYPVGLLASAVRKRYPGMYDPAAGVLTVRAEMRRGSNQIHWTALFVGHSYGFDAIVTARMTKGVHRQMQEWTGMTVALV